MNVHERVEIAVEGVGERKVDEGGGGSEIKSSNWKPVYKFSLVPNHL